MIDTWKFRLCEKDRSGIAEVVTAYERKYTPALSKPATASFTLRKDSPLLEHIFAEKLTLLQVWQNQTLRFFGPVISANYNMADGAPPSVAVSAADPAWFLTKRLSGKTLTGEKYTGDKAYLAGALIAKQNTEWNTYITPSEDECGSSVTFHPVGPFKQTLTCVNELAHGIDGFDWYIQPTDEAVGGKDRIGKFRAAAVVGSEKPNAVFEYGTGRRNMRSMNFLKDAGTQANSVYHISDKGLEVTGENPSPFLGYYDLPAIEKYGLYEELAELSGVNDATLRTKWCEEVVRVRKNPRRVLGMTSDVDDDTGRVPKFGTDYWLGDLVPCRADSEGYSLFDGLARVYAAEVAVNNAGTASVTPILVEEE